VAPCQVDSEGRLGMSLPPANTFDIRFLAEHGPDCGLELVDIEDGESGKSIRVGKWFHDDKFYVVRIPKDGQAV